MASVQGDSGVTDFGVISSRPGFMLHAEIQGKQVLVPVSGLAEGLGDKFVSVTGYGLSKYNQFAFGPNSSTAFGPGNPPNFMQYAEEVRFNARVTYEGVTQELEDLSSFAVDVDQGVSAVVSYGPLTIELPTTRPEILYPRSTGYVGFVVVPKVDPSESEFPLIEPAPGLILDKYFCVTSVVPVDNGWACTGVLIDSYGDTDPILPDLYLGGMYPVADFEPLPSFALGMGAQADDGGFAIGSNAVALGDAAVALGEGAYAGEYGAVALGPGAYASGQFNSVAIGDHAEARDMWCVAIGREVKSSGKESIAMGIGLECINNVSVVLGKYNARSDKPVVIACGTSMDERRNAIEIAAGGKVDFPNALPSVNGGDLVGLGIVPPTAKPAFAGQIYLDANNKKLYVAKAATATTDWVAIN